MKTNKYFVLIAFLFAVAFSAHAQSNFDMPKVAKQSHAKPASPKPQEKKAPTTHQTGKKTSSAGEAKKPVDMQQLSDYELELKASNGNAEAQYTLGKRWVLTGDPVNVAKGVNWLAISAQDGYSDAQYALGNLYYKGYGVERDLQLSRQWMQRAAANGNARAQQFLKAHQF